MSHHRPARSPTGHHLLLPATSATTPALNPFAPPKTFLSWTFGRGTVIWRIWPAVLLHTVFAAAVVSISLETKFSLGIPNVMLTLLGVVIGFVISYRAMSGYDRYWAGRTAWSDVMRTSRTFGRLIWFHVPLRTAVPSSNSETSSGSEKDKEAVRETRRAMSEKHMALDLVEAFAVSLKHHLRGEMGIYYEDLYSLVRPLHDHHRRQTQEPPPINHASTSSEATLTHPSFVIPPINSYGTFNSHRPLHTYPSNSSFSSHHSDEERQLLPSATRLNEGMFSGASEDMTPFSSLVSRIVECDAWIKTKVFRRRSEDMDNMNRQTDGSRVLDRLNGHSSVLHSKHRPRIAGGGENIPLEVVRAITVWLSVLERRGTVPGTTLGSMFGCLAGFEDSLSVLERILTTPLPFVFSVHIRTVWIYLFFLPFQLVDQFSWYTIPGVSIAAFIYLGFVASGEEIEQPFGTASSFFCRAQNDLDLDMFCREIIHADFEHLKRMPSPNVFLGDEEFIGRIDQLARGDHSRVEDLFGG
ncbi:Bestrophin, RFP-TM, chloride channel-domain-containing protein [Cristinia sonorae]|uniref:Bestrophin, RFP-TM, chloride channel-domain-containing protein n=1 Tax=Cristinia sonorae TaxID=1940300 RepID=A0A8K0UHU1_9AGAR|nr:Bestrophin, RFP-TM, chloride channel-domain-containing protein [Cristinia sonorae]